MVRAQLSETCTVSILNRSSRVNADGRWAINNVPAVFGPVRARATCTDAAGITLSGQTSYVLIQPDQANAFEPEIVLGVVDPIPQLITATAPSTTLAGPGSTLQLTVTATYAGGSTADVSTPAGGTGYQSSNDATATVSANGLVTAVAPGPVLISALNEGALGVIQLEVTAGAQDGDNDGIPDDVELSFRPWLGCGLADGESG